MSLNMVIQKGRLVADPTVRSVRTETGEVLLAKFRIAVPRDYKDKHGNEITDFRNCEASGHNANFIQQYYHKGDTVEVLGSWYSTPYEKDGVKRTYEYIQIYKTYPIYLKKEDTNQQKEAVPGKLLSGDNYQPTEDDYVLPLPDEEELKYLEQMSIPIR